MAHGVRGRAVKAAALQLSWQISSIHAQKEEDAKCNWDETVTLKAAPVGSGVLV